jgi:hypothetical protein
MNLTKTDFSEASLFPDWAVELGNDLLFIAVTIYEWAAMFFDWLASCFCETDPEFSSPSPMQQQTKKIVEHLNMSLGNKIAFATEYASWKAFWGCFGCESPLQPLLDTWEEVIDNPLEFLKTAYENPEYKKDLRNALFLAPKYSDTFLYGITRTETDGLPAEIPNVQGFSDALTQYVKNHPNEVEEYKKIFTSSSLPRNTIDTIFQNKDWITLLQRTINTSK